MTSKKPETPPDCPELLQTIRRASSRPLSPWRHGTVHISYPQSMLPMKWKFTTSPMVSFGGKQGTITGEKRWKTREDPYFWIHVRGIDLRFAAILPAIHFHF